MKNKVSLYIPCYNAAEWIARCLDGVFRQTYPIDEVLVIDDGPGGRTADIASRYPVRLIRRSARMGLPSARNAALLAARNGFVASIDADCVPEQDWLEKLMACFTDPSIAGAGGMTVEKHLYSTADKWRSVHMKQHWGDARIVNPKFLFGANNVFKKDAIMKAGLYEEEKYKKCAEDVDMSGRLVKAGYTLIYEPAAKVCHIRHDDISSLLMMHWNWSFAGNTPSPDSFTNIMARAYWRLLYSLRLLKEDFCGMRFDLLYIDALIFFHRVVFDLKYYARNRKG